MTPPRVLITGGGGFVGGALAAGFAALGWRVTVLDLDFDTTTRAALGGADLVTVDLTGAVPANLAASDLVVHAAAITTDPVALGWTAAAHVTANTQPLLRVLEHVTRTRPAAFVYLSSSGVFAPEDGDGALRDTDTPTGRSPYAAAKRAAEVLVPAALPDVTPAHVVRLGYVYGPGERPRPSRQHVSLVARWVGCAREGRPLDVRADDPRRDWTWAPDLAPALARLVHGPALGRPLHLCSPYVLSDSALAALIRAHIPGTHCTTVAASDPLKPPLRASDIDAWQTLAWTAPEAAIAHLADMEVRT